MNKKWLIAILMLVGVGGYIFLSQQSQFEKTDSSYLKDIESETTILGYETTKRGLNLHLFNSLEQEVRQASIGYSNANEEDVITPIQHENPYFLIQDSINSINDRILNVRNQEVIDLGWRGHSFVSENLDSILLARYEENHWGLILYDKKSGMMEEKVFHEEYVDASGVRVHYGLFVNNKWYIPYSSADGTFTIILEEDTPEIVKVSEQDLSDLWILDATNNGFTFYSGYLGTTDAKSTAHFDPKLNHVNLTNEVVSSVPIETNAISENALSIGYYKKDNSSYLMLFKTEGTTKVETVLIKADGNSERIYTSSELDVQSVKVNGSTIAITSFNQAIFVNNKGDFVQEINKNN